MDLEATASSSPMDVDPTDDDDDHGAVVSPGRVLCPYATTVYT